MNEPSNRPTEDIPYSIVEGVLECFGWIKSPDPDDASCSDQRWSRLVNGALTQIWIPQFDNDLLIPYLTVAEIGEIAKIDQAEFYKQADALIESGNLQIERSRHELRSTVALKHGSSQQ